MTVLCRMAGHKHRRRGESTGEEISVNYRPTRPVTRTWFRMFCYRCRRTVRVSPATYRNHFGRSS